MELNGGKAQISLHQIILKLTGTTFIILEGKGDILFLYMVHHRELISGISLSTISQVRCIAIDHIQV
jgi:hypothetical protein